MALTSGYLVIYSKGDEDMATLYDEYLNVISDLDPDSQEVLNHIENAEEVGALQDEMWDEVLSELNAEERADALVYRLENEVLTNAESNMERIIEENDDEISPGYNG